MIDLKNFIEQALLDITDAVDNARAKSKAPIAPGNLYSKNGRKTFDELQLIEFDLATHVVTSEESGKIEAKIAVCGVSLGIDSKLGDAKEASTTSRIKFQVPVAFNARRTD